MLLLLFGSLCTLLAVREHGAYVFLLGTGRITASGTTHNRAYSIAETSLETHDRRFEEMEACCSDYQIDEQASN